MPEKHYSSSSLQLLIKGSAVMLLLLCFFIFRTEWKAWNAWSEINNALHPEENRSFWKNLLWEKHPLLLQIFTGLTGALLLLLNRRSGWFLSAAATTALLIQSYRLVFHSSNVLHDSRWPGTALMAGSLLVMFMLLRPALRLELNIGQKQLYWYTFVLLLLMIDKWIML